MKKFLFLVLQFPLIAQSLSGDVVDQIERINTLRETLVQAVPGHVTKETFVAVCKPVGSELQKYGQNTNYRVKQATFKYRNPKNSPNSVEDLALKKLEKDKNLISFWSQKNNGLYYFRRISVQKACLKCHGAAQDRPNFIKKNYKSDKAFGFKVGDLRGIYSVFIPNKK